MPKSFEQFPVSSTGKEVVSPEAEKLRADLAKSQEELRRLNQEIAALTRQREALSQDARKMNEQIEELERKTESDSIVKELQEQGLDFGVGSNVRARNPLRAQDFSWKEEGVIEGFGRYPGGGVYANIKFPAGGRHSEPLHASISISEIEAGEAKEGL